LSPLTINALGGASPAVPLTRILIITDAWLPQINGVVRSIEALMKETPALGVEIQVLAANEFRTVPLPTYPQVRVAVTGPGAVRDRIEELKPDFIHMFAAQSAAVFGTSRAPFETMNLISSPSAIEEVARPA
jgi:hypothetical protein